jgi:hypothetical protein
MIHSDGTPYWEPTPARADARATLTWIECTGFLYSKGGTYLTSGTLDECAEEFLGEIINIEEDYGYPE